jgi:ureidoglycolate hydrolase
MSGHGDYSSFVNSINKNIKIYNVPILNANEETLKGYAQIVDNFSKTKVINVTWPKTEGRPLDKNTGNQAKETFGIFEFYYDKNYCRAKNNSVPNGEYITGVMTEEEKIPNKRIIYTFEANYHPDGGQIISPTKNNNDFIVLLSKAGDNIKPEDFVAFYCDGTFGIQILPNVWHQPIYPIAQKSNYYNKQCSVHGCVTVNTLEEFNTLLKMEINLKI